ncbi:MAG: SUMF1/EgtB/PvdO family nonheme iron enzyme [Fibromonadaceae bacterium]|jgi:hypothetical protein|nr:SUMF1/EgtB/PvdO family nonheme iron enzyme [Fibromonadaceae bacterium]
MQVKIFIFVILFSVLCHAQDSASVSLGTLSVHSTAPAAGVWMDGQAVGSAPFSVNLSSGWHIYSVRAPGHWTESFIVNVKPDSAVLNEAQLKKMELTVLGIPDISTERDVRLLERLYDSLMTLSGVKTEVDSMCSASFTRDYPLMGPAPAPLTDKSSEYHKYYEVYDSERMLSFREWHSACSVSLQQVLSMIRTRIEELGTEHLRGYAPVIAARFDTETADGLSGSLALIFRSKDKRADVAWIGNWKNEFLTGDELVRALTASEPAALSFITAQNQTVWIPREGGGYSRHLYKYYDFSISWNGLLIPLKGEFVLPDYLIEQSAVAQWLAGAKKVEIELTPEELELLPYENNTIRASIASIPGGVLKHKDGRVEVKPFNINTAQITQIEYTASCGKKDFGDYKGDSIPAHSVTWHEANNCCMALGGDLPTEAEWEYAARAGTPREYAWDSHASDYAFFGGNKPVKVAYRKPNGWGLYDMFGNVSEWVKDDGFWFGKYKFIKGGSYRSGEGDLKVENFQEEDARYWGQHVGFRCVFR